MKHVAVIGGGIAGIAASLRLAASGARVSLYERSNRLGGRAGSFDDPSLDEPIDNCQHVALGCCPAYLGLLSELGVADSLAWTGSYTYIDGDGKRFHLPIPRWPAPLHGLPLLVKAGFLSIGERLGIARAMRTIGSTDRETHRGTSFAAWLNAQGQSDRATRRFWGPIVVSACNATPETCDAASALHVFQDGFLRSASDARMAVPTVPLRTLYDSVPDGLAHAGGEVRFGAHITGLTEGGALLRTGDAIKADAVILALPFHAAAGLIETIGEKGRRVAADLRSLKHSPIVAVHAEFERPVTSLPHAVLLDADFDWIFLKDNGRRVHAVASAADGLVDRSADELVTGLVDEIARRFGPNRVTWARAVKERRATFLVEPGFDDRRPACDALAPRHWLAGDYTQTGWPATMEGATRSGQAAADAVIGHLGL
ncbi:MAG: hydroxysqualene dehydroxylase HpnE [Planctomycetota bacterium]